MKQPWVDACSPEHGVTPSGGSSPRCTSITQRPRAVWARKSFVEDDAGGADDSRKEEESSRSRKSRSNGKRSRGKGNTSSSARPTPTSETLHVLFPLPGVLFPQITTWIPPTAPQASIQGLLTRVFLAQQMQNSIIPMSVASLSGFVCLFVFLQHPAPPDIFHMYLFVSISLRQNISSMGSASVLFYSQPHPQGLNQCLPQRAFLISCSINARR